MPKSIVFNRDVKFLGYFSKTLEPKLGTKILFFTSCNPKTNGQIEVVNDTKELENLEGLFAFC